MQKLSILIIIVFFIACSGQMNSDTGVSRIAQDTGYVWTKLTDSAAFHKSYNFQMFNIRDTLWVLQKDGGWYSTDGREWTLSGLSNVIINNGFLDYIWFRNALYGLGTLEGNIEHYTLSSAIHRTTDMRHWELLAENSNLPRRFFYHPFVFEDKIWIIGGGTENELFSDIWNSPDGVHWEKLAEHLPFGKRQGSQFVFFNKKIFMLSNDAWSSTDGIHWSREADRFVPEEVFGYTAIVFDQKIWLFGCNRNKLFTSEALVSADGKTWLPKPAPWSPRGGMASCIHQNKIYVTGGKYGGTPDKPEFIYSNDVWTMEKKK